MTDETAAQRIARLRRLVRRKQYREAVRVALVEHEERFDNDPGLYCVYAFELAPRIVPGAVQQTAIEGLIAARFKDAATRHREAMLETQRAREAADAARTARDQEAARDEAAVLRGLELLSASQLADVIRSERRHEGSNVVKTRAVTLLAERWTEPGHLLVAASGMRPEFPDDALELLREAWRHGANRKHVKTSAAAALLDRRAQGDIEHAISMVEELARTHGDDAYLLRVLLRGASYSDDSVKADEIASRLERCASTEHDLVGILRTQLHQAQRDGQPAVAEVLAAAVRRAESRMAQ